MDNWNDIIWPIIQFKNIIDVLFSSRWLKDQWVFFNKPKSISFIPQMANNVENEFIHYIWTTHIYLSYVHISLKDLQSFTTWPNYIILFVVAKKIYFINECYMYGNIKLKCRLHNFPVCPLVYIWKTKIRNANNRCAAAIIHLVLK